MGPNWTPGTSPGSPNDIVEIPSGTVIYNNNFMIGTLIVGPNGTVDIVGGSLTVVTGVSNSGTIIVEGDPPALTINGPVTVGNIGSFTATAGGTEDADPPEEAVYADVRILLRCPQPASCRRWRRKGAWIEVGRPQKPC